MHQERTDYVLLSLGVVLVSLPLIFVVFFSEHFSTVQVYMRLVASLGGALIGAWLPGLLQIRIPGIRAGGAFAVLVLFWQFNPPQTLDNAINASGSEGGGAIEGDRSILDMQEPPDTSSARMYQGLAVNAFTVSGDASLRAAGNWAPGYLEVVAKPIDNRDNIGIEFKKEITPHYYMSVRMGGDSNIGTLELQGLGPEDQKIHFILSNETNHYFLWAGESNQQGWSELPFPKNGPINNVGMYQYGRYVVLFLNNRRVASFDTLSAQKTGRVGIAFKRQRNANHTLTGDSEDAVGQFHNFTVYQF